MFVMAAGIFIAYSGTASANWQSGLFSFVANLVSPGQASAANVVSSGNSSSSASNNDYLQAPTGPSNPCDLPGVPPVDDNTLVPDLTAACAASGSDSVNTAMSTYVVQGDDTLSGIALMFDISVDTIKQANHLSGDTIKPGQSLIILPVTGVLYAVQAKDSLQKIANAFKVDVNDIYIYNDMTASSTITVGQQLVIPHGKPSISEVTSFLSRQKYKVPSFEPLLDPVWNWPSYPGYFTCPLPGARLSQGLHGHNAVDLAIERGTPIHAAAAGTVIISKSNGMWNGGYGNFVMISHPNGVETLYAHMSKPAVSAGESVSQGEIIGYVGMTGMTTGPHTHFEIRGAQNPFVDPALCQ